MTKTVGYLCVLLSVNFFGLAGAAKGQQEQWLRYRTSAEPYQSIGGTYGHWSGQRQKPETTPPKGIKLPKFNSDKPIFAKWPTPAANGGHAWVALDRSVKTGQYDLLYIDSDLDGSLADEKPVKAGRVRDRGNYQWAGFKLVKVVLPGEDGPVTHHMNISYRKYNEDEHVIYTSAGWYEGPVTIGGRQLWCTLIDNGGNARFNDSVLSRASCDRIRIAPKGDKSFRNRKGDRTTRFIGRYIKVNGKLHAIQIAPDGAYVKIAPATKTPAAGTIQVNKTVNAFSVFGAEGHFFLQNKDGTTDVPVGEYVIERYEITRKDKYGARWRAEDRGADHEKPFTVRAGKTTTLDIGEPFVCKLSVSKRGNAYSINRNILTRGGDSLTFTRNGSRPPAPKIRITNADGSYSRKFTLEYG